MKFYKKFICGIIMMMPMLSALAKDVPLDNKNIYVGGAPYVIRTPGKLFFKRFSDNMINLPDSIRQFSAKTGSSTSGIVIGLHVKTSKMVLAFSHEPGISEAGSFMVMRNGKVFKTINYTTAQGNDGFVMTLDSLPKEGQYEIVMPSYSNFSLTKLTIDDNGEVLPYKNNKKVYIAFGDSITHGRGQDGASYFTYPFIVSQFLGMELFNQATGGARISVPLAKEADKLPKADVITILIGYNDLNAASHSKQRFESDYREYLSAIRRNQPQAKIYCINLLYTKRKENVKTHLTPDDFRNIINKVVTEYQKNDKRLYLIQGDQITSLENLQPGDKTDPVHLTVKGAGMFAKALYAEMKKSL